MVQVPKKALLISFQTSVFTDKFKSSKRGFKGLGYTNSRKKYSKEFRTGFTSFRMGLKMYLEVKNWKRKKNWIKTSMEVPFHSIQKFL